MPEDLGERTEEATPKRLADARRDGNVARSGDLAGALSLLAVTVLLWLGFVPALGGLRQVVETSLASDSLAELVDPAAAGDLAARLLGWTVRIGAPLVVAAWIAAYLANFGQIGWLVSVQAVRPKLSKLNPLSGLKRLLGPAGMVKAALDASKVAVVLAVVVLSIVGMFDRILVLPYLEPMTAMGAAATLLLHLALRVVAVLLVLGLLDYLWQRHKHRRDLRMTKTEVREELKQMEGDPETKKRRMRIQQQIALQRISSAVPKADVIITNPEHISIAVAYDADTMNAPKVLAKGQDHLALRIRQIALAHGIPIVERKPLARALYREVEPGQEIPPDFYQAVAEILAYVYRLAGKATA